MGNSKPIVLKPKEVPEDCTGVVRLTPEAESIVLRLQRRTGMMKSRIASEIIRQAEYLVEIDLSLDPPEPECAKPLASSLEAFFLDQMNKQTELGKQYLEFVRGQR